MSQREESCRGGTVADLHSALEGEGEGEELARGRGRSCCDVGFPREGRARGGRAARLWVWRGSPGAAVNLGFGYREGGMEGAAADLGCSPFVTLNYKCIYLFIYYYYYLYISTLCFTISIN